MSEIITPISESVSSIKNLETPTINSTSEISKLSKDYKFWARFNQVLVIIGGVFSLPIGALAIVGAVKLNKSIEIVDEVNKDSKSQEFVESVKEFHKWMIINVIVALCVGILVGIAFGALFFGVIMAAINEEKKNPGLRSGTSMDYKMPNQETSPRLDSKSEVEKALGEKIIPNTKTSTPFNISTEDGTMTMDANGNMKIVDKEGKVTTINSDGTMGTEK